VGNATNRLLDFSGGVAPEFMLDKNLSAVNAGTVYHAYQNGGIDPADYYLSINATTAETNLNTVWNDTEPTALLISLGTNSVVNGSGNLQILYYFAPKTGLQDFGEYTGNATTPSAGAKLPSASTAKDGLFFTKTRTLTGGWYVYDSVRGDSEHLEWNTTAAESTVGTVAFNATNGVDITANNPDINFTGRDYVWMQCGEEMVIQGDMDCFPVESVTSTSTNDTATVTIEYKGAATINTQLKVYASRESTPNWVLGTLSKQADLIDSFDQLTATIDISGNAAGTDMRWRIVTDESGSETEHIINQVDIRWA
jgi:hypothetical protein